MSSLGKFMIIAGLVIAAMGLFLTFGSRVIPLGRLPGDISIKREGFTLYFPVVTCIIISVVLTIILNLFSRR